MVDRYGDESASDQEDLVDGSTTELDDEVTDMDEMQFSFCKGTPMLSPSIENCSACGSGGIENGCGGDCSITGEHAATIEFCNGYSRKSMITLFVTAFTLLTSTLALLVIFPLYYRQLALGAGHNNAFGALLYLATAATLFYTTAAGVASWIGKWDTPIYRPPIPIKRLSIIATCCGLAGSFCAISSYERVPCHLQDPLKGAALVYSLVFYFFFCRKVMGLQRIFSATTAVVGLFISVDYGLCDEFRCRGAEITFGTAGVHAVNGNTNDGNIDIVAANVPERPSSVGWQGGAVWTLIYVAGIALWTLHLSLLEGHFVTFTTPHSHRISPANLLTTVSRIVSNAEPLIPETPKPKKPKRKPRTVHLAAWIHAIAFVVLVTTGWLDLFPGTGHVKSLRSFWSETESSVLCHFNIQINVPDIKSDRDAVEFLANLTPDSRFYNRTVQHVVERLKRSNGGSVAPGHVTTEAQLRKLAFLRKHMHFNKTSSSASHNAAATGAGAAAVPAELVAALMNGDETNHTKKVNTEKHWHQQHWKLHSAAVGKMSHLVIQASKLGGDCDQLRTYAWLMIPAYVVFAYALLAFLSLTESAVFTVVTVTAALPLIGIFWSMFELTVHQEMALIIWSPEVTGELICSLLGTPIVFLGVGLLCRAHFYENVLAGVSMHRHHHHRHHHHHADSQHQQQPQQHSQHTQHHRHFQHSSSSSSA